MKTLSFVSLYLKCQNDIKIRFLSQQMVCKSRHIPYLEVGAQKQEFYENDKFGLTHSPIVYFETIPTCDTYLDICCKGIASKALVCLEKMSIVISGFAIEVG